MYTPTPSPLPGKEKDLADPNAKTWCKWSVLSSSQGRWKQFDIALQLALLQTQFLMEIVIGFKGNHMHICNVTWGTYYGI